jgi:hypothetical protein
MSEKDYRYIKEKERLDELREKKRLYNLNLQDQRAQEQFDRVNRLSPCVMIQHIETILAIL